MPLQQAAFGDAHRIVELEQQPSAPDEWRDVGTGETYGQAWVRMDDVERRQLMLDSGVRVMAWTNPLKLEFIVPEVLLRRRVPGYEVPVWASGEGWSRCNTAAMM